MTTAFDDGGDGRWQVGGKVMGVKMELDISGLRWVTMEGDSSKDTADHTGLLHLILCGGVYLSGSCILFPGQTSWIKSIAPDTIDEEVFRDEYSAPGLKP